MPEGAPFSYLCWALLLLSAACRDSTVGARPVSVAPPSAVPLVESATQLPALQRARLDYVFDAAERVRVSWPFMTPAGTCVLLIEVDVQWVLNCAQGLPGFVSNGSSYRGHEVYRHVGGTFASAGQARSTAELLALTPAAAHVRSLGQADADGLPGTHPWLVIGSLEALAAFHPAFADATTEAWVSVAIHELIHTHQLRAPGFDVVLTQIHQAERDPSTLTQLFGRDARYRALVEREYTLLTRAAARAPDDRRSARQALRAWLALYAQRQRVVRPQLDHAAAARLTQNDALFSYLEGVARFVESDFLDNSAQHPETTPRAALAEDARFHDYALFRGRGYAGSPNRQLDEQYFYAIGYHLCVLLERLDPSWKQRVHSEPRWLIGLVQRVASAAD